MGQAVFDFSGTTTVITGGASGIGLTCAELIAKCGGDVVVSASRRPDKTEKALDRIRSASGENQSKSLPLPVRLGPKHLLRPFLSKSPRQGFGLTM